MTIEIHKSSDRGSAEHGWLHSKFSFSFADYHNSERMNFGALRVLNDDIIEPGAGFGMHFHENMEIITIVLEGVLEHKDSIGSNGIIPAGDVQRMSAGKGITHSEFNHSKKDPLKLLQIWVQTKEPNIKPSYEQKSFSFSNSKNEFLKIVSGYNSPGALYIYQEAVFLLGFIEKSKKVSYKPKNSKHGIYVFVIEGKAKIRGKILNKRDAAAITGTTSLELFAIEALKALVIEVPLEN
ncbi:MAG: pirin family protein [Candidatus Diapherotrites archaeon]|nr:pirin family protein [Candidatus Diapherotrites archaeon]